ncbi:MAG TPA: cyclopropane fatty acyl phospholipid synthase, partial [Candidatus Saccharimonadales bacterium]
MSNSAATVEKLLQLADVKINGSRAYDIQVHNEGFYKRAVSQGELGIGEAYMDGWWSSKRLDETVARILAAKVRDKIPITPNLVKTVVLARLTNSQKPSRAYDNAEAHYNVGNDLYALMLDKRMIYSCGFWQTAKTLDEAQEAKLDRICKKLYLKPGMTLLDIGCGWGGFAEFAAKNYGVKVTGISPASEQVELAKQRTKGLDVTILRQDYREATGKYDRITSIGMREHVGPKNHRTFFTKCNVLLKDGGLMLHHSIGLSKSSHTVSPWIDKYIFPGGVIPSLAQLSKATERLLVIEDVE